MRFVQVILVSFLAVMLPLVAHAKAAKYPVAEVQILPVLPPVETTYDIYVGGLHLVTAHIWFEEQGNVFHTIVRAQDLGLLARFLPWNTILESYGRIKGDHFEPKEFFTRDEWNHKPKITKLHFNAKGDITPEFIPPSGPENREEVTLEQRIGSLDPVTALLQMLAHVAVDNSCAIPVPVFDGKRRFDIVGRDDGNDTLNEPDYEAYSGKARQCAADFKMISGEWKDAEHARFWKKTESEAGREPFHIWLASPAKGMPEIPVRMETGSIAGLVVIHLTSWHYVSAADIKAQAP